MTVRVLGSFESGLIIQADRPSHLNNPQPQSVMLTPSQASELFRMLVNKVIEDGGPELQERAKELA